MSLILKSILNRPSQSKQAKSDKFQLSKYDGWFKIDGFLNKNEFDNKIKKLNNEKSLNKSKKIFKLNN